MIRRAKVTLAWFKAESAVSRETARPIHQANVRKVAETSRAATMSDKFPPTTPTLTGFSG